MATQNPWIDGLKGATRRIVESTDSPLRVVAGPGTGKTFAIIRKIANALHEGADPRRIFVSTFTRTAATDLTRELSRIGVPGTENVVAGTLHSFCFRLLRSASVFEITRRHPRPLLDFERRFMLEDIKGGDVGGIHDLGVRLRAFNAAWARLQSEEPGWPDDPADVQFGARLESWLRFHRAIEIGEVVPIALRYLRDNPLAPVRPSFDHVIIDEYQDLNRAEQTLLDLLSDGGRIVVVGDEDQSIYSFKYAHREGIAEFADDHPGTVDEHLIECRRCPIRVITMANALISRNQTRSNRVLVPLEGRPEGEIFSVQWPRMGDEAQGIAQFIRTRIAAGSVSAGEVLVLAPRRQFGYEVRDQLVELGIDARSFFNEQELDGNPKLMEKSFAQQQFSALRLLADPDDVVSLRCWLGFGSGNFRSGGWTRLRTHCENSATSPRDALNEIRAGTLVVPYTLALLPRFKRLLEIEQEWANLRGKALLDAVYPPDEAWTAPFREMANEFVELDGDASDLVEAIERGVSQPDMPTDVDYVRVMSLHKSKGLTSKLVVISGLVEGILPSGHDPGRSPLSPEAHLEEQRRLLFVALTRTTETLVLSTVVGLPGDLANIWQVPILNWNDDGSVTTIASTFLGELGPDAPTPMPGATAFQL